MSSIRMIKINQPDLSFKILEEKLRTQIWIYSGQSLSKNKFY